MAVTAYLHSHSEVPCAVVSVAAQAKFLKIYILINSGGHWEALLGYRLTHYMSPFNWRVSTGVNRVKKWQRSSLIIKLIVLFYLFIYSFCVKRIIVLICAASKRICHCWFVLWAKMKLCFCAVLCESQTICFSQDKYITFFLFPRS